MAAFDIDLDGVPELVIGYANGLVEARAAATGDVVVQDKLTESVAGLCAVSVLSYFFFCFSVIDDRSAFCLRFLFHVDCRVD